MPRALIRRPSPRLEQGLLTHVERQPVDNELARRQWNSYVAALAGAGWDLIEVPASPTHADSVFIEDTMVMWGDTAVIARPGAFERRGEVTDAAITIASLGFRTAAIEAPATLDGGDVLKVGQRMYVGIGGRTTDTAVAQLDRLLDAEVIGVPVSKVLHLKSAVTALPDGTVIGYPPLVDDIDAFDSFLAVPEETGAHVVVLDPESVLMASSAPLTADLLRQRGLAVTTVDIGEFEKLEGCVTCLSVRLRD